MKPMLGFLRTNNEKYKYVSLFFSNVEDIYDFNK